MNRFMLAGIAPLTERLLLKGQKALRTFGLCLKKGISASVFLLLKIALCSMLLLALLRAMTEPFRKKRP